MNTFQAPVLFQKLFSKLTAYDLLALTVVIMLFGHMCYYFLPNELWLRVPDRIVVPVFLVLIGYNAGYKFSSLVWAGAILLFLIHFFLIEKITLNILITLIMTRALLLPLLSFLLKSEFRFWYINFAFIFTAPFFNIFFEYGTLAFTMAIAGWIARNRVECKDKVDPVIFFIFATLAHIFFNHIVFGFSYFETFIISIGSALIMYILYNFKYLLLNSIRRRPEDIVEKACSFIGRKSFEIYVIHIVIFELIFYFLIINH